MRTLDNKTARFLILSAMTSVLLTAFANCGTYSDNGATTTSSLSVTCDDDCITPTVDNLALKVNMGSSTNYNVGPITDFNLGGDCNEAGFPYNTIVWELFMNGQKVRDSNMAGTAGSGNANSACKNGKFIIYVYLGPIASGDNVNRTGLAGGSNYTLSVEIYGQSVPYGPAQRNQLTGRRSYTLTPVATVAY